MDDRREVMSRMLDVRSKEPLPMEYLDSERVANETLSFEVDPKSSGSAVQNSGATDGSKSKRSSYSRYAHQQSSYIPEHTLNNMEETSHGTGFERNDSEVIDVTRDTETFRNAVPFQFNDQQAHGIQLHQQNYQGSIDIKEKGHGVGTFRTDSQDIEFSRDPERSSRDTDITNDYDRHGAREHWLDQNQISRKQQEKPHSSMTSDMSKAPARQIAAKNKKSVVSAETKARWAMLRSLAGTGKGEAEDNAGAEKDQNLVETQSMTKLSETPTGGASSVNGQDSSSDMRSSYAGLQQARSRIDFQVDEARFVRSSRAAVEAALRRSGPGRRQSSRGEIAESDPSISRAASVKRYMEKLRSDPHIDVAHFAGLPTDLEGDVAADVIKRSPDVHRDSGDAENALERLQEEVEHDTRRATDDATRKDNQLGKVAERAGHVVSRGGHILGRDIEREGRELKEAFQREEIKVGREAEKIRHILDNRDQGFSQGSHQLQETLGKAGHSLDVHFDHNAEKVKESLKQDAQLLDRDVHSLMQPLASGKRDLERNADRILRDLGRGDKELKEGVHVLAGNLRFGKIGAAAEREQQRIEQDVQEIEDAFGLKSFGQALHRDSRDFENEAEGFLRREAQELEQKARKTEGALDMGDQPAPHKLPPLQKQSPPRLPLLPRRQRPTPQQTSHQQRPPHERLPPQKQTPLKQHVSERQEVPPYDVPQRQQVPQNQQQSIRPNLPHQQVPTQQQLPLHQQAPPQQRSSQHQQQPEQQNSPYQQAPAQHQISPHQQASTPQRASAPQQEPAQKQIPAQKEAPPQQQAFEHQQRNTPQPFAQQRTPSRQEVPQQQQNRLPQQLPLHQQGSSNNQLRPTEHPQPHGPGLQQLPLQSKLPTSDYQLSPLPLPGGLTPVPQQKPDGSDLLGSATPAKGLPIKSRSEEQQTLPSMQSLPQHSVTPVVQSQEPTRTISQLSSEPPLDAQQGSFNFQDSSHHADSTCVNESPYRLDSPSETSNHPKSSAVGEESGQTATGSTISMSPRLESCNEAAPSPPSPSPHAAVFEHLIFGFKQSSEARIAAAGGHRGFMDQITELFVKMAEDASPAIQQRLEENARC